MHKSVLLKECIEGLQIKSDGVYVDATLGYGGHSSEILKRVKKGFLYAIDQDIDAIKYSDERLSKIASNYEIIKTNFVNLQAELNQRNIKSVDGILFDLGVSSPQLDVDARGFSYHHDAKLDMRMDQSQPLSAYEVVNNYPYADLVRIFRTYGEEKYASSIAKQIVSHREDKPITTTLQLVDIIKEGMPYKAMRDSHPARKVFQAIRIEVNHELDVLSEALEEAISMLKVGGHLCVITFHSLEDRLVKQTFKKYSEVSANVKNLPFIPDEYLPSYQIVGKSITPSPEELNQNNRARSSRLRIIERIKE